MTMLASSQTNVVLLLSALGVSIFLIVRRFLVNRHYERIHGCKKVFRSLNKDPFLGLDTIPGTVRAFRQHKLLERSCEFFRLYGNTFAVKELQRRAIVTIEPENIKTILSLKFSDYGLGHRLAAFKPLLGQGIFDTDGESWAASRALVRPSFTRDRIADLSSFEDLIQDLFSILPRDASQVVDLSELYFRYTIDSATEFLFGQSTGSLKQTASEPEFAQSFHYAQQGVLARLMLGPLSFLYRDRKAEKCNQICREFASRFVEKSFVAVGTGKAAGNEQNGQNGSQKRVISDELALRTTDRERVLDETMNLLLAGRDTTASLLSNLFFMLAKDHLLWRKIRRDVACLEGRPPTYQELRSFKFIQHCISECKQLMTFQSFIPPSISSLRLQCSNPDTNIPSAASTPRHTKK